MGYFVLTFSETRFCWCLTEMGECNDWFSTIMASSRKWSFLHDNKSDLFVKHTMEIVKLLSLCDRIAGNQWYLHRHILSMIYAWLCVLQVAIHYDYNHYGHHKSQSRALMPGSINWIIDLLWNETCSHPGKNMHLARDLPKCPYAGKCLP